MEQKEDFENVQELTRKKILERRKQRQKELITHVLLCSAVVVILVTICIVVLNGIAGQKTGGNKENTITKYIKDAPEYREDLLTINEYSRPGIALEKVNGIVIHYTGNPGTTAQQNRDYFENLSVTHETKVSSHFIIGLSGEIILCVPLEEIAYASNDRNSDTISIECCIEGEDGKFNEATYLALVQLTAWLMGQYDLEADDVIRHYDVTGKSCPKYFVDHESAWEDFKSDVVFYIEENGVLKIQ